MALILSGPLAAAVSGKEGGTVFSRNRYGAYVRVWAKPVAVQNVYTEAAKARFGDASQLWGNMDPDERQAWITWAQTNPITNRLGIKQVLDGHAAAVQLNARILKAGGTTINVPPVIGAPDGLITCSLTAVTGGAVTLTYTATPVAADHCLWIRMAVVNSPGVTYVANSMKLVHVSAAAAMSPQVITTDVEARFGLLAVGQRIMAHAYIVSKLTGMLSSPLIVTATVT